MMSAALLAVGRIAKSSSAVIVRPALCFHPFFIKAGAHFCCTICFLASCQLWEVIILALKIKLSFSSSHLQIIKTEYRLKFKKNLNFNIFEIMQQPIC